RKRQAWLAGWSAPSRANGGKRGPGSPGNSTKRRMKDVGESHDYPGQAERPSEGRAWALFDQAADLPPAEQQRLLDAACADDPALRAEVERLLAGDARLRA